MKSLNTLVCSVVKEVGAACSTDVSRDLSEIARRVEAEGEGFLTIALPRFGKAFDKALDSGSLDSVSWPNFRVRRGIPLFLSGLLSLVFDRTSRCVLDQPDFDAIVGIRQIAYLVEKIFEVCDPVRAQRSVDGYVKCESEMEQLWYSPELLRGLRRTANEVFGGRLRQMEETVRTLGHLPAHGPGATADRLSGNGKWDNRYWPERLNEAFPAEHFTLPGYSHRSVLDSFHFCEPGTEMPVKVITVPKTAAKARIIAMEPTALQYAQQSLLREFLRGFGPGSPFVDLTGQDRNRRLAQRGSVEGDLVTIDLSEASDRVAAEVVRAVFGDYPNLCDSLFACRSERASLPDGTVVPLVKFASMGSATCFPVEALVFATSCLNSIRNSLTQREWRVAIGRSPSSGAAKRGWLADSLTVFGDDIIVPKEFVPNVMQGLASLGAKPNLAKTFLDGKFRESCGGDYFRGEDVSIVRLRKRLPASRQDHSEVLSLVSFRNQLYMAGLWNTVAELDERIKELIPLPIVEPTSPVVGRTSVAFGHEVHRYHRDYQTPLVKGLLVRTRTPDSPVSELGALLKCLLPGRSEPIHDVEHLVRSGRADRVCTRVGWAQPF